MLFTVTRFNVNLGIPAPTFPCQRYRWIVSSNAGYHALSGTLVCHVVSWVILALEKSVFDQAVFGFALLLRLNMIG